MAVATGPVWLQLHVFKDRAVTASLVQRAEAAGCKAIVLTVDVPVPGRRERDVRNRSTLPDHLSLKNLLPAGYQGIFPIAFYRLLFPQHFPVHNRRRGKYSFG